MTRNLTKVINQLIELAKKQRRIKGNNLNYIPIREFIDLINAGGKIVYLNEYREDKLYHHRADYKLFIFLSENDRKIYDSDELLETRKK